MVSRAGALQPGDGGFSSHGAGSRGSTGRSPPAPGGEAGDSASTLGQWQLFWSTACPEAAPRWGRALAGSRGETTGTSELREDPEQQLRVSEHTGGDGSCLLFLPSSLRVAQNHEALWGRTSQRGDSCSVCPGHFSLGLNWHKRPVALSSPFPHPILAAVFPLQ